MNRLPNLDDLHGPDWFRRNSLLIARFFTGDVSIETSAEQIKLSVERATRLVTRTKEVGGQQIGLDFVFSRRTYDKNFRNARYPEMPSPHLGQTLGWEHRSRNRDTSPRGISTSEGSRPVLYRFGSARQPADVQNTVRCRTRKAACTLRSEASIEIHLGPPECFYHWWSKAEQLQKYWTG